jgi:predicted metal-dependent HD superfamily phosphohydrolase
MMQFTRLSSDPTGSVPKADKDGDSLAEPHGVSFYLRLCEAIGRFTAASVADDPAGFRVQGADLRYVVERHLYFSLAGDRGLYRHFVASECDVDDDDHGRLPELAGLIAPYLSGQPSKSARPQLSVLSRILRIVYRRYGRAMVQGEGAADRPARVLFLVINPKFVRYLRPIAEALPVGSAFLTIEDQNTFEWLEAARLPRVGIELTPTSAGLIRPHVRIAGFEYSSAPFDGFSIRFNAIRAFFQRARPDCIVVPEGNAPINELVNRAAQSISIPTLCIQQGWSPVVHPGFRNMTYSGMCVWGDGFADLLAAYNPKQRFIATGNHIVVCRRQGDDRNRTAIAFFLQKSFLITEAAWSHMLDLIAWSAREFPDSEVRVREHPSVPLAEPDLAIFNGLPNIRMAHPELETLNEVLVGCRVAVAMYSTTILEAAATGAVPLILNVNGFDHYSPNIAAEGGAVEVQDFAQARTALSRLMLEEEYWSSFDVALDRVRQRFFARDREEALAAIVAEIESLRRQARP